MESKILLDVPGKPVAKQRPRWSKHGTYTPTDTKNYETYIKELFATCHPDFVPLEGELIMKLNILFLIPKSTSKRKSDLMEKRLIRPAKKPDVNNVINIVFDALEGLAYKNDSQIVTVIAQKFYSGRPRVEIEIYGVHT